MQNPAFGFYFLRLASARLFQNIATLEQRLAQQTAPAARAEACLEAGIAGVASVLSSLRYLFADVIGDDDDAPPFLPDGLPDVAAPVVSEGIHLLIEYQGPSYAQLYVDRLRRFVGRRGVDDTMICEIARLMAVRMSYQDPIRIAQLKLVEYAAAGVQPDDVRQFQIDKLVGALPATVAEPLLDTLEYVGWLHKPVSIRFSTASRWGLRRLKVEAAIAAMAAVLGALW